MIYPGILITILAFAVYWMEPEAQPVESPLCPVVDGRAPSASLVVPTAQAALLLTPGRSPSSLGARLSSSAAPHEKALQPPGGRRGGGSRRARC